MARRAVPRGVGEARIAREEISMKTAYRQRGIGMLGLLLIAIMVGVYVLAAIRIVPGYIEYQAVRGIIKRVAEEYQRDSDTSADIRRSLSGYLNTNQVKAINYRDVELRREEGKLIIDGSYEQRVPLFWRIDLVMRYDDLAFEAGVPQDD